jgi:PGAP1-like protein.
MGHSMGGVVATSLLSRSHDISAVITMSTPHTLPPARFDSRIDMIYAANQRILNSDSTPIVSLCGGATDMMVPSESCVLPTRAVDEKREEDVYRRTVFTSALEGAWTGVGHQEMVWCHQVRWRVARAALELGASATPIARGVILDKWLRDGHTNAPPMSDSKDNEFSLIDSTTYEVLPEGVNLILNPPQTTHTYLLPLPSVSSSPLRPKFVLFVSQGSILHVSPQNPLPLRVSVHLCTTSQHHSPRCSSLRPTILKLIPNPVPGQPFPVPNEGADESEGVVFYEADLPSLEIEGVAGTSRWVGVRVEGTDGRGWLVGGFNKAGEVTNAIGTLRKFIWPCKQTTGVS